MPRYLYAVLIGSLSGFIIHLYLLLSEEFLFSEVMIWPLLGSMLLGAVISLIVMRVTAYLDHHVRWTDQVGFRLVLTIGLVTVVTSLFYHFYLRSLWDYLVIVPDLESGYTMITSIKLVILVLVFAFIISILSYVHYSYRAVADAQINQVQLKREIVDLQMETLRSQLRPHFLFNSLNTISSLIHAHKQGAELFIRRLAAIYDYTLQNYNQKSVALEEELTVVISYVEMMKARFGDNIILDVDVDKALMKKKILPLSLQSLVENAQKHNVVNDDHQLTISISANEDIVRVKNNKTVTPNLIESYKIGLDNLKKRYRLWGDHKVSVYNYEDSFAVTIPID